MEVWIENSFSSTPFAFTYTYTNDLKEFLTCMQVLKILLILEVLLQVRQKVIFNYLNFFIILILIFLNKIMILNLKKHLFAMSY